MRRNVQKDYCNVQNQYYQLQPTHATIINNNSQTMTQLQFIQKPTNIPTINQYSKNNSKLSTLILQIKQQFQQLKQCSYAPIKQIIIASIMPRCNQALQILLHNQLNRSQAATKYQNILSIKNKVQQIDDQLHDDDKIGKQIGNGGRHIVGSCYDYASTDDIDTDSIINDQQPNKIYGGCKYDQKMTINKKVQSSMIIRTIVFQQIKSANLKISNEQLQKILTQMQNNAEVVKFTEKYLLEQGLKLDQIQQDIQTAYKNAKQMNGTLHEASEEQVKSLQGIQTVFRTTASGLWGIIKWPFGLLFPHKK